FDPSGGSNVFSRHYTLTGPQDDTRLLPTMRVVAGGGDRYFYGTQWQQVWRIDAQTGVATEMQLGTDVPELSWPSGITFDSLRNRIVLVSFGGEGYLYAYSPALEQWSLISSMNNLDVQGLVYHAPGDALY